MLFTMKSIDMSTFTSISNRFYISFTTLQIKPTQMKFVNTPVY